MKHIILYFFLLALTTSCASIKVPDDFNSVLDENNIKSLEGTYDNISNSTKYSLWEAFCKTDIVEYKETIKNSDSKFKLSFDPNDKIRFDLYIEDELRLTRIFKYSIHENGIRINGSSNYRYFGVPLILFSYKSQALWFSKDNKEELFLSFNGESSGGILIIMAGEPLMGEVRFRKLDE